MSGTALDHPLVRRYLRDLDAALSGLPAVQAHELMEQITAHLDDALGPGATDQEVAATLARLGSAAGPAAEAGAPGGSSGPQSAPGRPAGALAARRGHRRPGGGGRRARRAADQQRREPVRGRRPGPASRPARRRGGCAHPGSGGRA